jgi:hypothetical protein
VGSSDVHRRRGNQVVGRTRWRGHVETWTDRVEPFTQTTFGGFSTDLT